MLVLVLLFSFCISLSFLYVLLCALLLLLLLLLHMRVQLAQAIRGECRTHPRQIALRGACLLTSRSDLDGTPLHQALAICRTTYRTSVHRWQQTIEG